MNTLGLKRPVYSFGLGLLGLEIGWREVIRFSLNIKRRVSFSLER